MPAKNLDFICKNNSKNDRAEVYLTIFSLFCLKKETTMRNCKLYGFTHFSLQGFRLQKFSV